MASALHAGLLATNPDYALHGPIPEATRHLLRVGSPMLLQGEPLGVLFPRYYKPTPHRATVPPEARQNAAKLNEEGGLTCPYTSELLSVDEDIMQVQSRMATAFASDATARCVLWAL